MVYYSSYKLWAFRQINRAILYSQDCLIFVIYSSQLYPIPRITRECRGSLLKTSPIVLPTSPPGKDTHAENISPACLVQLRDVRNQEAVCSASMQGRDAITLNTDRHAESTAWLQCHPMPWKTVVRLRPDASPTAAQVVIPSILGSCGLLQTKPLELADTPQGRKWIIALLNRNCSRF